MRQRWSELPLEVRGHVLRLAAEGRIHPDFKTAETAYLWARDHGTSWGWLALELLQDCVGRRMSEESSFGKSRKGRYRQHRSADLNARLSGATIGAWGD